MPSKSIFETFWEDPDHPLWNLIRQFAVMIPLAGLLAFGYKNGWSNTDYVTVLVTLTSLGTFDWLKKKVTSGSQFEESKQ